MNNPLKDFTPTQQTVSLHGLGFIQIILPENHRLHVWHPELPRRKCFEHSAIHNHRFSFSSRVLKGVQVNQLVDIELAVNGSHQVISHNGARSDKGGRISYPVAECNIHRRMPEEYRAGQTYYMQAYEYHCTPNTGCVITLMQKLEEGQLHASSLCAKGIEFDTDFDRFQYSTTQLFDFVMDAFLAKEV